LPKSLVEPKKVLMKIRLRDHEACLKRLP